MTTTTKTFSFEVHETVSGDVVHVFIPNYGPVISEYDNSYYRVLIEQNNTDYTIHTGDNMMRILAESQLPKELRVKLAMVKAYETRHKDAVPEPPNAYASAISMYLNETFPSEFNDIGWRCNCEGQFYCVITTAETLDSLRGESINKGA